MNIQEITLTLNEATNCKHPTDKLRLVAEYLHNFREQINLATTHNFEDINEYIDHYTNIPLLESNISAESNLRHIALAGKELKKSHLKRVQSIKKSLTDTLKTLNIIEDEELNSHFIDAARAYHLEQGELEYDEIQDIYRWTASLHDEDEGGIIPFRDALKQLEKNSKIILDVLETSIKQLTPPKGRPPQNNHSFFHTIAVMAECLLGLKIKNTNNQTDDYVLFTSSCIQIGYRKSYSEINVNRAFKPCFTEEGVIRMAYLYKNYNRLDLFIDHVVRAGHQKIALDYFNCEWEGWTKPSNYSRLEQGQ